jgi:alpha-L-rhamnosidase
VAAGPAAAAELEGALRPARLRAESQTEPLGLDVPRPRLGWILEPVDPAHRGGAQRAYQIQAAASRARLDAGEADAWDSGKVASTATILIPWAGRALRSGERIFWRVRSWDGAGRPSPWSAPSWFEMALLAPSDWQARWIEDSAPPPRTDEERYHLRPAPLLRREFDVEKPVARARAYVSGLGYYELSLNGKRVGDHALDPGWTTYSKRTLYSTYDVTAHLTQGRNAAGLVLGNGWWNPLPFKMFNHFNFREFLPVGEPRAIVQLEITYEDGSVERIVSDPSWRVGDSPILRNNVYLGELYDARKELPGWDRAGFDDRRWRPAKLAESPVGPLRAQDVPPIKVTKTLRPVSVAEPRPGLFVFDLGQNFAGWVTLRVQGAAGTRVSLRFSELLFPDGTPNGMTTFAGQVKDWKNWGRDVPRPEDGTPPRTAWQQDVYILKGGGPERYTPRFTWHGFRYVAVEGFPGRPTLDALEGHVLHAAVESAGTFASSNDLWNKIQEAVLWSQRSNMFSVQSDCPHRERLGYGGDIVATSEMAILNFDMARFYAKAVRDFADGAMPNGGFPETAPYVGIQSDGLGDGAGPIGWGIAHPVLLRDLYTYYGDRALLEEQYEALVRWTEFVRSKAKGHLTDRDISDHEAITPRPKALTGTAFYHHNVRLTAEIARILGRRADAARYEQLAGEIRAAFNAKFLDPRTGRYDAGNQTCQVFPLQLGLVPPRSRPGALQTLLADIDKRKGHLSTGIFGTKYLLEALSAAGRGDVAARVVDQRDEPGWGYMLANGATTLWESWRKDERVMSHNHPMFGSVSEWLWKHVAGIAPAPDAVGFDRIVMKPDLVKEVSWARGRYESVRGAIESSWRREGETFVWDVRVPVGSVATAHVPARTAADVRESGRPLRVAPGVKVLRATGGATVLELKPGVYQLTARLPAAPLPSP